MPPKVRSSGTQPDSPILGGEPKEGAVAATSAAQPSDGENVPDAFLRMELASIRESMEASQASFRGEVLQMFSTLPSKIERGYHRGFQRGKITTLLSLSQRVRLVRPQIFTWRLL